MDNKMTVAFGYSDLWSFYNQTTDEIRRDIIKQLNLDEVLQYGTLKLRKEILSSAPQEVIDLYKPKPSEKSIEQLRKELYSMFRR